MRHRLRQWIKFGGKFPDFKEKEEPVSWWKWWRISHGDMALGPRSKFQFDESNRFWVILVSNHPYSIHIPSMLIFLCDSLYITHRHGRHGPRRPHIAIGGTDPLLRRLRVHHRWERWAVLAGAEWSWALGVMGVMRHLWLKFQWTKCEKKRWKDDKHGDVEWVLLCDL